METLEAGQVFGLVTLTHQEVVYREGRRKGSWWVGVCSCGAVVGPYTKAHWLKKIRSCSRCRYGNRKSLRVEGTANAAASVYRNYRSSATKRGHKFEITKDEFLALVVQPCYYCTGQETSHFNPTQDWEEEFRYTGLDRIDSRVGYRADNLRPCCKICNRAKSDLTEREFSEWIERVSENYRVWDRAQTRRLRGRK